MATELIHSTAILGKNVQLGRDVSIGSYATVEDDAVIGDGTRILQQAHVRRGAMIGKNNLIDIGAVIGGDPQRTDGKNAGTVRIGDNNVFREYVTIHRSTEADTETRIGNNNYFMALSHVAHDCKVGDHIIIANAVLLGGHVQVDDYCVFGGGGGIHQFCRVGRYAMIGGCATVTKDVLPYMLIDDNESFIGSLNITGLRRAGFSEEIKRDLKNAYKFLSKLSVPNALEKIAQNCHSKEAAYLVEFAKDSKRGILGHRKRSK